MIPLNLLTIWGYKDESLTPRAADMRNRNIRRLLEWDPQWSFLHLNPPHILKLAQELPQSVRDLVVAALQLNTEWVWKADVSRIVALYANGGLYVDVCDVEILRDPKVSDAGASGTHPRQRRKA